MTIHEIKVWFAQMRELSAGRRDEPAQMPGSGMREIIAYLLDSYDEAIDLYVEDECEERAKVERIVAERVSWRQETEAQV